MTALSRWPALLLLLLLSPIGVRAGLPLPSLTFYGLFTDEFGWPYAAGDLVEIRAEGVKILSQKLLPAAGRDYNFIARVPYDSGGRQGDYNHDVVSPGERVTVSLVDRSTGTTVISTNFVCQLPAGSVVRLDLASGQDSLRDGLPDPLREWIWSALGDGEPFEAGRVRAGQDADGDGVNNLDEFLAGTDPANGEDTLKLGITAEESVEQVRLEFFAVPGKSYRLMQTLWTADGPIQLPVPFAVSRGAPPSLSELAGTGRTVAIYVPAGGEPQFLRVALAPQRPGGRIVP
jgi:hypothetical protein